MDMQDVKEDKMLPNQKQPRSQEKVIIPETQSQEVTLGGKILGWWNFVSPTFFLCQIYQDSTLKKVSLTHTP